MARVHLVMGLAGVVAFLATGLYMRLQFPGAYAGDATMRMLFRSAHIYLLLASLMNVLLGVYAVGARSRSQRTGSVLLLLAPLLFLLAFAVEPSPGRVERPYALAGAVAALAGTMVHLVVGARRRGAAGQIERGPEIT